VIAMPCDTRLRKGQTISQRKAEVRDAVTKLNSAIIAGRVKPIVGPQGAIAFQGWRDEDRSGVTDACAFRMIMISGSALAKAAIARAEQLAGRSVDRRTIAHGVHSHDDGHTWHDHKG
jgi:hypothetical protein